MTALHTAEPVDQPTEPLDRSAASRPVTDEPAPLGAHEAGELLLVDPSTLEIRLNVRTTVKLTSDFVNSIRDNGVLQPPIVRRRASDGVLVVRYGQRRVLGAIEAGCNPIRVVVEPQPAPELDSTAPTEAIERIVVQVVENEHRDRLTSGEVVAAHQQLLDLGLNASEIAKQTRMPRSTVRDATRIARSPLAAAVAERHNLDLQQLVVIQEFDQDPEAVKALTVTAVTDPAQFDHVTERLRRDRAEKLVYDTTAADLTRAGVRIVDAQEHPEARQLWALRRGGESGGESGGGESGDGESGDGESGDDSLTEDNHSSCPGHAAVISVHPGFRGEDPSAVVRYHCTAPGENGHVERYPSSHASGRSGGRGPMSEEQKIELRRVKRNNKEWDAAAAVRLRWLTKKLAGKAAPAWAARFVAAEFGQGDHTLRRAMESGNAKACQLLGLDKPSPGYYSGVTNPISAAAQDASPGRSAMLALGVVLGAYEAASGRDSWRNPMPATKRYFECLRDWGYALSPVEGLVLDPDADTQAPGQEAGAEPGPDSNGDPDSDSCTDDALDDASTGDSPTDASPGRADATSSTSGTDSSDSTAGGAPRPDVAEGLPVIGDAGADHDLVAS